MANEESPQKNKIFRGYSITELGSLKFNLGTSINEISTDGTLAGDSDDAVPTEKAVKTYVDSQAPGSGDMTAAVYDPTSVAGDAFDMDNMAEGTSNKILTAAERTILGNTSGTNTGDQDLSGKQDVLSEGAFVNGDKTKLDGIESGADVTDTANVTSAGALMDSEVTDLSGIKSLDTSTLQVKPSEGAFVNGDKTKLDGIETGADVTDTANVTAAGALMDSEVTNLAQVKSFSSADYAAASHNHTHADITDYDTELAGKTNTTAFTPTSDYHVATKKYVDDNSGGVSDHGALTGLSDDDHTQYTKADGTRSFTGKVSYNSHPTFSADTELVDKKYVDDEITGAGGYNDEAAQDAVGTILTDSSEIDFTYNDGTPSITASIVAGSIDETKLDTSVNTSLDLADSSVQPGDNISGLTNDSGFITATLTNEQVQDIVGAMVSGNTESGITVTYQDGDGTLDFSVASQTDNNFTTVLKNKLDAIEANADVTDVTNVTAAGALMDSEVDADIKTLSLPANTTISTFGASLIDDVDAVNARSTLDVDQAGTDNSTNVTLNASATTGGMSLSAQEISNQAATNAQNGYMTSALVTNIESNNAKVTNATHTGEVTGSGALTVDKTAITGKGAVTADGADYLLISDTSDSGNLKKALASDLIGAGGGDAWSDAVDSDILSDTTNTRDLGSASNVFAEIHGTTLFTAEKVTHEGDVDTYLQFLTNDINLYAGGASLASFTYTGLPSYSGVIHFNTGASDVDFRIDADAITYAFYVDGSTGRVSIGTNSNAGEKLNVEGAIALDEISAPSNTAGYGKIYVKSSDSKLYYLDSSGSETDLTASGSGMSDLVDDTTPTLGGDLDANSKNITNIKVTSFNVTDDGNSSTADTIDFSANTFHKSTLTGDVTFTFTAPFTGSTDVARLELKVVQDGTGGRDITFPANVVFPSGEDTWTDGTAGQTNRITLIYDDDDDEYVAQSTGWY